MHDQKIESLEQENSELKATIDDLKNELALLKTHPVFRAGLQGETLIRDLVGGELTSFAEGYDIQAGEIKIEVKYSNLGIPDKRSQTRRWSWSKPLGWKDKGKLYDFLVLVGEKDRRFPGQYLDTSPYVCFLIPHNEVEKLMFKGASIGGIIQITTNFTKVTNKQSLMLLRYLVRTEDILTLIESVKPNAL